MKGQFNILCEEMAEKSKHVIMQRDFMCNKEHKYHVLVKLNIVKTWDVNLVKLNNRSIAGSPCFNSLYAFPTPCVNYFKQKSYRLLKSNQNT